MKTRLALSLALSLAFSPLCFAADLPTTQPTATLTAAATAPKPPDFSTMDTETLRAMASQFYNAATVYAAQVERLQSEIAKLKSELASLKDKTTSATSSTIGTQIGRNPGMAAANLELSDALPAGISMNAASVLTYQGNLLENGRASVPPTRGFIPKEVRCDKILTFPTQMSVRMKIDKQNAQSLLGATRVMAASLGGVWLEDKTSEKYFPIGYVRLRASDQMQEININRDAPIQSAKQLPVQDMTSGDLLYLYFAVPHRIQIVKIRIGASEQVVNNLLVP